MNDDEDDDDDAKFEAKFLGKHQIPTKLVIRQLRLQPSMSAVHGF